MEGGVLMELRVYRDAGGEWRWSAVAGNGEKVGDSGEGYVSKSNALRAARQFRDGLVEVDVDIIAAGDG